MSSEIWRGDAIAPGGEPAAAVSPAPVESGRGLWHTTAAQTTLLLLTGIALGPSGLAILPASLLERLQPLVAVTLVALAVVVAIESLSSVTLSKSIPRLFSIVVVSGGLAAALIGRDAVGALLSLGRAVPMAIALAAAGWVLAPREASDDERRIFSVATFLLIGGVADYLAVPALLTGWTAAVAWRALRPADMGAAYLDAAYVQGPASALLLILAGAHVQFSWLMAGLALVVVVIGLLGRRALGQLYTLASGISIAPAALVAALLMDAARLNPDVLRVLSVVVLAMLAAQLLPRQPEVVR